MNAYERHQYESWTLDADKAAARARIFDRYTHLGLASSVLLISSILYCAGVSTINNEFGSEFPELPSNYEQLAVDLLGIVSILSLVGTFIATSNSFAQKSAEKKYREIAQSWLAN